MLGVARLTNGIRVAVYNGSGLIQHLSPAIKGWNDWALVTGGADASLQDITNTKLESGFRWTFAKYSDPSTLTALGSLGLTGSSSWSTLWTTSTGCRI
jgi:hypothetical protein